MPLFGAHMSIAGGPHTAFARGQAVGCECLAVFVKNNLQWGGPKLTAEEVEQFHAERRRTGIGPVVAHATYLINLASPQAALRRRSERTFADELARCAALGIEAIVLHPGSHKGSGEAAGLKRIAESLRKLLDARTGEPARILLEGTAGGGNSIGGRFEQLAEMISLAGGHPRLGVCLDTAHLHAAGYDLRTDAAYEAIIRQLDATVGIDRVAAFHLNDTKVGLGTHSDRHAHVGTGQLKRPTFARLIADPRWSALPMLLETPKGKNAKGRDWDAVSLRLLKRLRRPLPTR